VIAGLLGSHIYPDERMARPVSRRCERPGHDRAVLAFLLLESLLFLVSRQCHLPHRRIAHAARGRP